MTRDYDAFSGTGYVPPHFNSSAEMIAAMQDPRYRTDPAYRDEVAQKVLASGVLGVRLGETQHS
jgi:hypothetical protein